MLQALYWQTKEGKRVSGVERCEHCPNAAHAAILGVEMPAPDDENARWPQRRGGLRRHTKRNPSDMLEYSSWFGRHEQKQKTVVLTNTYARTWKF